MKEEELEHNYSTKANLCTLLVMETAIEIKFLF